MKPLRYRIVVEWSDEDQVYVSRIPAFPGLLAFGSTAEDATREAITAAEAMLEVLAEDKEAPPPEDICAEYSGKVALRLPKLLHRQLSLLATAEGVSVNQELVNLLARGAGLSTLPAPHSEQPQEAPAAKESRKRGRPRASVKGQTTAFQSSALTPKKRAKS